MEDEITRRGAFDARRDGGSNAPNDDRGGSKRIPTKNGLQERGTSAETREKTVEKQWRQHDGLGFDAPAPCRPSFGPPFGLFT